MLLVVAAMASGCVSEPDAFKFEQRSARGHPVVDGVEFYTPDVEFFSDGWPYSIQEFASTSRVPSSVESTEAARKIWPEVVKAGNLCDPRSDPDAWRLEGIARVWLPQRAAFEAQTAEDFWDNMLPADTFHVVMARNGDDAATGFTIHSNGDQWEYDDGIPGVASVYRDKPMIEGGIGGIRVLDGEWAQWGVYESTDGELQAMLLSHPYVTEFYIEDQPVLERLPVEWSYAVKPFELR